MTVRFLNFLGLLIISGVLLGGFGFQFHFRELPCPLCLLQRIGMMGICFGALLNLRFGIRPSHYGVSLLSAVFGASVSIRQILLHIDHPKGFGTPIFGMHMYTWAFVVACVAIVLIGVMLIFDGQFRKNGSYGEGKNDVLYKIAIFLFALIALGNVVGTFIECGISQCPDNPTVYKYWS